jgi:hypothetical protein
VSARLTFPSSSNPLAFVYDFVMRSTNSVNSTSLRAAARARSCATCSPENSGLTTVPNACASAPIRSPASGRLSGPLNRNDTPESGPNNSARANCGQCLRSGSAPASRANKGISSLSPVTAEIIRFEGPRELATITVKAPLLFVAEAKASERFWEFFTANIRNRNMRRAYYKAACRFSQWSESHGLHDLGQVKPIQIAAFIEELQLSKPTVKQHLAALRMLFDWLVVGHIISTNPAHAVRGPKHSVRKGKTPVLTAEEARMLLDSTSITRTVKLKGGGKKAVPYLTGMRDRALIALMVFTFARVGAAVGMKIEDYFIQGRRG